MVRNIFSLFLVVTFFISCSRDPITGRSSFKLLPESELIAMANSEYRQFLSTSKVVSTSNNRDAEMVKRVGERIVKAVKEYYTAKGALSKLDGYQWEYHLVQDNTVNAWCMPGGKIVIYTGILPVAKNEAALAAIMGHEVSHALFNHGNERMSQGLAQQLGGVALSVAMANKPQATQQLFNTAYGIGSQVGVMLPFSRKHELEADRYGLIWTAMAGYNPEEAIGLWERMGALSAGQKPPEFLSTHPAEDRRIKELQKYMPEALSYYKPVGK